jgi:WD40 repeat protein
MSDPLLDGVVQIFQSQSILGGTGFVLSRQGLIATCSHVIQAGDKQSEVAPLGLNVPLRFQRQQIDGEATVIDWKPYCQGDIALLQLKSALPQGVRPLPLSSASMTKGHEIYTYGYPARFSKAKRTAEGSHASGRSYGSGPRDTISGQELLQIQSREITKGFSGAPVWDAVRHEVIGMLTLLTPNDKYGQGGSAFAILADHIVDMCRNLDPEIALSPFPPHPGARKLYEGEAKLFFGFEHVIEHILNKMRYMQQIEQEPSFLALLGPAQSGKSSVMQAGVIPPLREDAVPGSAKWEFICVNPGSHPYAQLEAQGLIDAENDFGQSIYNWRLEHPRCQRIVLVFDQFEETLLRCPSDVLYSFIADIEQSIRHSLATIVLIVDHVAYHVLTQYPYLAECLERGLVNLVPTFDYATLRVMTTGPADVLNVSFEPGLVDICVDDALRLQDTSTQIPLSRYMMFLSRMWMRIQKEGRKVVNKDDYAVMQSIMGDVNTWAEQIFANLNEEQQQIAHDLLIRLIDVSELVTNSVVKRRIVLHSALINSKQQEEVTNYLVDAGLFVTQYDPVLQQDVVLLALEALPYEWERLRGWISQELRFLSWRQELKDHIRQSFAENGLSSQIFPLLRSSDLTEAELWKERYSDRLNDQEREWIEKSIQQRLREDQQRLQEEDNMKYKYLANARRLAAEAKKLQASPLSLQKSVRVAIEAISQFSCPEAYNALRTGIALLPKLISTIKLGDSVHTVAISENNAYLLAAGRYGIVWRQGISGGSLFSAPLRTQCVISQALFHPDGNHIFTMSEDGFISIWDTKSGVKIQDIECQACQDMMLSGYGESLLAILRTDGEIGVWQCDDQGYYRNQWRGFSKMACTLLLSRNGRFIATSTLGGNIRIWDARTGQEHASTSVYCQVHEMDFTDDGSQLALACDDGVARVWYWTKQRKHKQKEQQWMLDLPHEETVTHITFYTSRAYVITTSGKVARLWKLSQQVCQYQLHHDAQINKVLCSVGGPWVATCSDDGTARLWDIVEGRELIRVAHNHSVKSLALSPNGKYLLTGSEDGTARLWDTLGGTQVGRIYHQDGIHFVALQSVQRGHMVAVTGGDGWIQLSLLEGQTLRFVNHFYHEKHVHALAFHPTGEVLASASEDHTVRIWNTSTGVTRSVMQHQAPVYAVAFSYDGSYLASAGGDGHICVYDYEQSTLIATLVHPTPVSMVTFGSERHIIVSGSQDEIVRIWDLHNSCEEPKALVKHASRVTAVACSNDGQWIASASEDGALCLGRWVLGDLQTQPLFDKDVGIVNALAFSPDGNYLATTDREGVTMIWETSSATLFSHFSQSYAASDVSFSPDGRQVITANNHYQATAWDLQSQKVSFQLPHAASVKRAVFSADGKYVVTLGRDRTVSVWIWRVEDLVAEAHRRLYQAYSSEEYQSDFGHGTSPLASSLQSWRTHML